MAWETEMVEILRVMVNDLDKPFRYTDIRLQKLIVSASQMLQTDSKFGFKMTYVTDIVNLNITPDPTEVRDDSFINLCLLKAGCFVDNCVAREAARKGGISIREWNTSLDTKGIFAAALAILEKGWCKNYQDSLYAYESGNSSMCTAVLSPFRTIYNAFGTGGYSYNDGTAYGGR